MSLAGSKEIADRTPVHENVVERAGTAEAREVAAHGQKKPLELRTAHLARRHHELTMLDRSEPTYMTLYGHVVRRIGYDQICALPAEQGRKAFRIKRVPAQQLVRTNQPQVSKLGDRRG